MNGNEEKSGKRVIKKEKKSCHNILKWCYPRVPTTTTVLNIFDVKLELGEFYN